MNALEVLPEREWLIRRTMHERRVDAWMQPMLDRRSRGLEHPVEDFLFDYYPYPPSRLRRWSPEVGRILLGASADQFLTRRGFTSTADGVVVEPGLLRDRRDRLAWVRALLTRTHSRPPSLHCFGLHEWAMVYGLGPGEVRHPTLPLRVSPAQIRDAVDTVGLRCSHYDAFRFFTDEARPLNTTTLSRAEQPRHEQPGCLHAAMDLYKYAMWLQPLLPSEVNADAFELALVARRVDMRASPYDVTQLGDEPIRVESVEGRKEYTRLRRELAATSQLLRRRMLDEIEKVRAAMEAACVSRGARAGDRLPAPY